MGETKYVAVYHTIVYQYAKVSAFSLILVDDTWAGDIIITLIRENARAIEQSVYGIRQGAYVLLHTAYIPDTYTGGSAGNDKRCSYIGTDGHQYIYTERQLGLWVTHSLFSMGLCNSHAVPAMPMVYVPEAEQ